MLGRECQYLPVDFTIIYLTSYSGKYRVNPESKSPASAGTETGLKSSTRGEPQCRILKVIIGLLRGKDKADDLPQLQIQMSEVRERSEG